MLITHDTEWALATLVELLNTAPAAGRAEGLPDTAALRAFVREREVSEIGEVDEGDLAAVRAVRSRFAEIVAAPTTARAAALLNAVIAEAGTTPRLTDHDGHDWHMHYFAPGAALADHLAADTGMALGYLLTSGERERLQHCGAPDCSRLFVDLSRNRSRRYCDSRTCGNRLHVAAYRARRRESAAAE